MLVDANQSSNFYEESRLVLQSYDVSKERIACSSKLNKFNLIVFKKLNSNQPEKSEQFLFLEKQVVFPEKDL